jgi:hypothetical protein
LKIALLTNDTRLNNGWGRSSREFVMAMQRAGARLDVYVEEAGGIVAERVG